MSHGDSGSTLPNGGRVRRGDRRRRLAAGLVGVAVAAAAILAVTSERHTMATTLSHLGVGAVLAGAAAGLAGVAVTGQVWAEVVGGLGVVLPRREALRVFFRTQLGKYAPGAVWPIVLQVEAGRKHGASRRTMLTASLLNVVLSIATGLLVACVVLPFSGSRALAHYWPVLVAVVPLLLLLHPRALPAGLDLALRVARRPPLGDRVDGAHEVRAVGWSLLSWTGLGTQVYVLCGATGHRDVTTWLLSVAAVSLAIPLGVLFVPAPAGAGVREAALTIVLEAKLHPGQALAVAVASRALLVICDLLLAALASVAIPRLRHAPADHAKVPSTADSSRRSGDRGTLSPTTRGGERNEA